MQLSIPITKAGNKKIIVETDDLIEVNGGAMYQLALQEGLKVLLNKNMSKITTKDLEGDDLEEARKAAYTKGEENFAKLMKGEVKTRGSATDSSGAKVPAIVLTEAKRLAKEVLKDNYRNKTGKSPSQVAAKTWTEAAVKVIQDDPSYIEQAKANIEARKAKAAPKVEAESADAEAIAAAEQAKAAAQAEFAALGIVPDHKLVLKAEEERKARKAERQLSKTQAGIVKPRKAKPQTGQHIH